MTSYEIQVVYGPPSGSLWHYPIKIILLDKAIEACLKTKYYYDMKAHH